MSKQFNNLYSIYPLEDREDEWNMRRNHDEHEIRRFQNPGSSHCTSLKTEAKAEAKPLTNNTDKMPKRNLPFYGLAL